MQMDAGAGARTATGAAGVGTVSESLEFGAGGLVEAGIHPFTPNIHIIIHILVHDTG